MFSTRWASVVHICLASACGIIFSIGISGYMLFYTTVDANFIDMMNMKDGVAVALKFLLCLAIAASIPYATFMPRVSLTSVFESILDHAVSTWRGSPENSPATAPIASPMPKTPANLSMRRRIVFRIKRRMHHHKRIKDTSRGKRILNIFHYAITTLLLFAALLIAESVTDLGSFLELVGSVSAAGIGYILPPLLYIFGMEGKLLRSWKKIAMLVVLIFGIFVLCISTGAVIFEMVYNFTQPQSGPSNSNSSTNSTASAARGH